MKRIENLETYMMENKQIFLDYGYFLQSDLAKDLRNGYINIVELTVIFNDKYYYKQDYDKQCVSSVLEYGLKNSKSTFPKDFYATVEKKYDLSEVSTHKGDYQSRLRSISRVFNDTLRMVESIKLYTFDNYFTDIEELVPHFDVFGYYQKKGDFHTIITEKDNPLEEYDFNQLQRTLEIAFEEILMIYIGVAVHGKNASAEALNKAIVYRILADANMSWLKLSQENFQPCQLLVSAIWYSYLPKEDNLMAKFLDLFAETQVLKDFNNFQNTTSQIAWMQGIGDDHNRRVLELWTQLSCNCVSTSNLEKSFNLIPVDNLITALNGIRVPGGAQFGNMDVYIGRLFYADTVAVETKTNLEKLGYGLNQIFTRRMTNRSPYSIYGIERDLQIYANIISCVMSKNAHDLEILMSLLCAAEQEQVGVKLFIGSLDFISGYKQVEVNKSTLERIKNGSSKYKLENNKERAYIHDLNRYDVQDLIMSGRIEEAYELLSLGALDTKVSTFQIQELYSPENIKKYPNSVATILMGATAGRVYYYREFLKNLTKSYDFEVLSLIQTHTDKLALEFLSDSVISSRQINSAVYAIGGILAAIEINEVLSEEERKALLRGFYTIAITLMAHENYDPRTFKDAFRNSNINLFKLFK